jgi:hypothetical protein
MFLYWELECQVSLVKRLRRVAAVANGFLPSHCTWRQAPELLNISMLKEKEIARCIAV